MYKPCLQESYHITAEIRRRSGTNPEHNPQLNPSGAVGIRCGNWSASWHFSLVSPEEDRLAVKTSLTAIVAFECTNQVSFPSSHLVHARNFTFP